MFLKGHSFFLATLAETVQLSEELISAAKIAWQMEKRKIMFTTRECCLSKGYVKHGKKCVRDKVTTDYLVQKK